MAADDIRAVSQLEPAGLLGLLQAKNGGLAPRELLGGIRPTVDLLELWLNQEEREWTDASARAQTTDTTGDVGAFTPGVIVPPDQWWYVRHFTVWAPMAAGDSIEAMQPAIITQRVGTSRWQMLGTTVTRTGQGRALCQAHNFWAPPGSELAVAFASVTAAVSISIQTFLRFSRLPV